jgi:chromosome segregation ATPase
MLNESFRFDIATLQTGGAESELSRAGDSHPPEVESHLNRLLSLWNRLKSITDQASDVNSRSLGCSQDFELLAIAALKEAECADLIEQGMETELTSLCGELKQKDEALQARETALARLEETSKAKLAELETHIQIQENQLRDWETERQQLTSERDHLICRLEEAELAGKRLETESQVSALSLQMAERDDSVAARQSDLHRAEGNSKTDIENLQLRLQDAEAKLLSQERMLKEKETGIHAAMLREKEIGKLIERLSSECEKLSAELCEKELIISRLENTTRYHFIDGAKVWGKVLRIVKVGRRLLGQYHCSLFARQ